MWGELQQVGQYRGRTRGWSGGVLWLMQDEMSEPRCVAYLILISVLALDLSLGARSGLCTGMIAWFAVDVLEEIATPALKERIGEALDKLAVADGAPELSTPPEPCEQRR